MIFSKKKEELIPYTVEKCNKCNRENKRSFQNGDYLFLKSKKCDSCDGDFIVESVFGEPVPK